MFHQMYRFILKIPHIMHPLANGYADKAPHAVDSVNSLEPILADAYTERFDFRVSN
jgi:hypothetical protein